MKTAFHRRAGVRKGVTLVEILVTTCVIGMLVGLLLPAIQMVRRAADEVERLLSAATLHLEIDHVALLAALRAESTGDQRDARTALRAMAFAAELDGAWLLGAADRTPPREPVLHFE